MDAMNDRTTHPTRRTRRALLALMAAAGLGALAGCASLGPDADGADRVTASFFAALRDGDGGTACGLLNDSAREAAEEASGADCPSGILTLGIDADCQPSPTEVYSRAAFVETGSTAVFLTPGPDGWLIRAAGCEPVEDAPFECALDGS